MKKVVVVGAGIGGLATAARLASRGYEVEVFERLSCCGGRNNIIRDRGFAFDTGPSFVLMPDFFREVFSYCGMRLEDYLDLVELDVHYKIFYPDGTTLSVCLDPERTKEELERHERGAAQGYLRFLEDTGRIYRRVEPLLYRCLTPAALLDPSYWPLIKELRPHESYWDFAKRYFKSDKLCHAFTFEAMFIGVSPYQSPAFYSIIGYADHVQKIRHPMGGMYRIPLALESLSRKLGVNFHYDTEVKRILGSAGSLVVETAGSRAEAERIVVNADFAYAQQQLLGRSVRHYRYSCSVYLLYLGLRQKVAGAEHHNLFFARDLYRNLDEIFNHKRVSVDPSFYVHAPTVTDPGLAPAGKEIFYILVPVPNLDNCKEDFSAREGQLRRTVFDRINRAFGIRLEDLIEVEHRFYPQDFTSRYNIPYGATFGLAHNLMQSAFLRPANFDRRIRGLYYTGASTQPGGGLPVVLASSRIVADLIEKEAG